MTTTAHAPERRSHVVPVPPGPWRSRPRSPAAPDWRGFGAGHLAVEGAERLEPDVNDFGVPDSGQICRDVGPRANADEDFLAGIGGGAAEQHAAAQGPPGAPSRHASPGHGVQPRGRQRVGIAGERLRRRGEVPAVALLMVGPPATPAPASSPRPTRAQSAPITSMTIRPAFMAAVLSDGPFAAQPAFGRAHLTARNRR